MLFRMSEVSRSRYECLGEERRGFKKESRGTDKILKSQCQMIRGGLLIAGVLIFFFKFLYK